MKRFKLIFKTYAIDAKGVAIWTEGFTRIIAAKDHSTAARFAQAMSGEEIDSQEYLANATIVEETGEDYDMASYDSKATWQRVLKNLNLKEKDVEWIADDFDKSEIVGIKLK